MSEYCWCTATPAIEDLIREHDELVELSAEAREAYRRGDLESLIDCCARISTVLGPHTVVEERGLFPPMAAEFPEKIAILRGEHRRIEAVLAGAADGTARTDPTWAALAVEMLTLLRRHIVKEQEGLFPAALAVLSNEQWDMLTAIRAGTSLIGS
ncbi:hypothetical protein FF36_05954 [Frankia torreyi]|uniref:Hemerythrin-like domain-containing protein n=2 Tax=Frankia TaxID=1854 RepID=A0A0D8B6N7_9ACTN|nr:MULTISPECIES: hemerythrin domain-containing protein [Frankia]KJE19755.1 hypothetical protein FF36_05954 [Frankia torreyi]KQC38344.1 hemerythrin HHE cation-binding protein [Frankia sp. ACN1ag]KQM02258.1 hypothetical protein FF86_107419 [Frankia sp. CpI1-P]